MMLQLQEKHLIIVDSNFITTKFGKVLAIPLLYYSHNLIYMRLALIVINIFLFTQIFAQNTSDDVLFSIGNETVSKSTFVEYLKKNSVDLSQLDNKTIEQYVEIYIGYKLKIKEAKKEGYSNSEDYRNKVSLYKTELSKGYLADNVILNKLVDEAYRRLLTEIRVEHILVKINPYSSKKDSLIAYNKAIKIKKRIVNGENFNLVAKETSDDALSLINGGDLWYISAFNLPYDLENYIYKAKQNSLVGPVKTKLGYHIIKIGKRRVNFGSFKVAQILLNKIKNDTLKLVETKINDIYKNLKLNNNFSKLVVKYSEDEGVNLKNGVLPWFSTNQMPHEFEEATYALMRNGDISKPVQTKNAWHIIKRIDRKGIPSLTKIREQVEQEVKKSDRYDICKQKILKKVRKENKIKEYYSIYEIKSAIDSTIFEGKWEIPDTIAFDKILFSINNKKYFQSDFVKYLYNNQKPTYGSLTDIYVDKKYKEYFNIILWNIEEEKLGKENENYRKAVDEFSEDILYYYFENNMMQPNGNFDTKDFKKYYSENKYKYNNKLTSNLNFLEYNSSVSIKKLKKYLNKYISKNYADAELIEKLEKSLKSDMAFVKKGKFIEGENKIADIVFSKFKQDEINKKTKYVVLEEKNIVVCIKSKIEIYIKPFETVKEKLILDYNTNFEQKKLRKLKLKYNVSVNKKVLETLLRKD